MCVCLPFRLLLCICSPIVPATRIYSNVDTINEDLRKALNPNLTNLLAFASLHDFIFILAWTASVNNCKYFWPERFFVESEGHAAFSLCALLVKSPQMPFVLVVCSSREKLGLEQQQQKRYQQQQQLTGTVGEYCAYVPCLWLDFKYT